MIVLLNTNFAYIAMIASSGFFPEAFEANLFGLFHVERNVLPL